jgi:hypothetical protein
MHSGEPDPIFPAPRRPRKGPGKLVPDSRRGISTGPKTGTGATPIQNVVVRAQSCGTLTP